MRTYLYLLAASCLWIAPSCVLAKTGDISPEINQEERPAVMMSDRTGITVSGGATFRLGDIDDIDVPVEMSDIIVDSQGSGKEMSRIRIYVGSGDEIPSSKGSPIYDTDADTDFPSGPGKVLHTVEASKLAGAPDYESNQAGYWIWVIIEGETNPGGFPFVTSAQRFMAVGHSKPDEFPINQ